MADIVFVVSDPLSVYRITTKRLTVGDGIAIDTLQDDLARRDSLQGRELLHMVNHYPLIKYGTAAAERAILTMMPETSPEGVPVLPDDLIWQPVDITETVFLTLDEWLFWNWLSAVLIKNPHRDQSYEQLKKNVMAVLQAQTSASALTSATPNAPDDKTTFASSS
jgi:hypothetical protein